MLSPLSRVEVAEYMTADEFFQFVPETQKTELIRGVMIVTSPPMDVHERANLFLLRLMSEFVEMHDLGEGLHPVVPDVDGWLTSEALSGFRQKVNWLWPQEKFVSIREALEAMGAQGVSIDE